MRGMGKEQQASTTIRVLDDPFEWTLCDTAEEPGEGEVRTQVGDVDSAPARAGLAYETVSGDARARIELLGASDDTGDVPGLLAGLRAAFEYGGGSRGGNGAGELVVFGRLLAGEDGSWARWGCNSGGLW